MNIETKAKAIVEARATIAPVVNDFYSYLDEFAKTVKEFCQTNKWYTGENKWSVIGMHTRRFWGNEAQIVNGTIVFIPEGYEEDYSDDFLVFDFDEIDNPEIYVTAAFELWKSVVEARKAEWKNRERENLERKLRELN